MAGGKQLGSVVARIGADTSEFQDGLKRAGVSMDGLEKEAARAAGHLESGIQKPMLLAGKIAGQFAGDLSSASSQAVNAIGGIDDATKGAVAGVAKLGDSVLSGAAAFGTLSNRTLEFKNMSPATIASMGGLAIAVGTVAYEATRLLDKWTGFTDFLKDKAKTPVIEYGLLLAKDEEQFQLVGEQVDRLVSRLKLSGPEWQRNTEFTKDNAMQLAELQQRVVAEASARNKATIETREHAEAMSSATRSQWDSAEAFAAQADATASYYDVMTRADVEEAMGKLVTDFETLVNRGASAGELMKGFGTKLEDVATSASTYQNLNVPNDFERLRDAIQSGSLSAVEDLAASLKNKLPEGAKAGSEAARKALEEASEKYADSLSGGMGRGIEKGISAGDQAIVAWMNELASKPVTFNLKMNYQMLAQQLRELGLEVNNSGAVPA